MHPEIKALSATHWQQAKYFEDLARTEIALLRLTLDRKSLELRLAEFKRLPQQAIDAYRNEVTLTQIELRHRLLLIDAQRQALQQSHAIEMASLKRKLGQDAGAGGVSGSEG